MTLNKNVVKEILIDHYFSIGHNISFLEADGCHEINSKNIKVNLEEDSYFLKIIDDFNKDTLKKIEIINDCFNDGVKLPRIIRNKEDKLVTIYDDKLFFLTKYCEGEKFKGKKEEIFSAGENLAVLNKNLSKYDSKLKRSSFYDDLTLDELKQIEESEIKDKKIKEIIKKLPELYSNINKNIKRYKNKQLVHLDYHKGNVLFSKNQVNVILDFDSILTSFEFQSIAFACERFSSNAKEFLLFLEGYQKISDDFKDSEMLVMPDFAKKEAINRINYIIRKQFFYSDKTWAFELDKHLKIIKRMDYLKNELEKLV